MMLFSVHQFVVYSTIVTSVSTEDLFRSFVVRLDEIVQLVEDQKQVIEDQNRMIDSFNKSQREVFFTAKLSRYLEVQSYIDFDTIVTNEGGGFNSSSGRFNAPVNGTYFFIVTIVNTNDKVAAEATLTVNGNNKTTAVVHNDVDAQQTGVCSLVVQLVEQDEVSVKAQTLTIFRAEYTTFSGYLIHEKSEWNRTSRNNQRMWNLDSYAETETTTTW